MGPVITVEYVQTMAQYNAWQNASIIDLLGGVDDSELSQDRGAFFGSILGTLNHLLWGDQMWMSRLAGRTVPSVALPDSPGLHPTYAAWKADRQRLDGQLVHWAGGLRPAALRGNLTWYSGALDRELTLPVALLATHMFNHQTHHRGQVHAMLTSIGLHPGVTDLFAMPGWRKT